MAKLSNRRLFLKGLGGAAVAAPFLGSVWARMARGASGSTAPAKRLIVMYTHNGCVTTRFFPRRSHGALSAADLEATSLAPLAPYADKLLIPRGIRAMNEWNAQMSRGQGNDPHLQANASYFTCQPVTPNSDDPFNFDQATKFNAKPVGRSLDHVIAEQLSPGGAPLFLRVGGLNDNPMTGISYSAPEMPFPGYGNPLEVFSTLTGVFRPGAMTTDTYQAIRGRSIVDLVRDDLETLERYDMSQADRLKLAAWKELLHETGGVMASAQCTADNASALSLSEGSLSTLATGTGPSDRVAGKVTGELDGADLHSNLAVLAALCNANPVIFLKYPFAYVFSALGIDYESTGLAHRIGNAGMAGPCVEDVIALLLKIDDFYARKFAHLVGQLDAFGLLDESIAVWFQEMSDGSAHNLNNIPIVQAGSGGGYFKTGWAINVEDGREDLSNGNSESACTPDSSNMVGGSAPTTGTDPAFANAPINKYYVNLMNALGVKAGDDGFPLKNGPAEVAKFGMYDKTEDFIHGGTNPPLIRSPGGFDALKAT